MVKNVEFNKMELLIIKEITRMIMQFFPKGAQIYKHAEIIYKKL